MKVTVLHRVTIKRVIVKTASREALRSDFPNAGPLVKPSNSLISTSFSIHHRASMPDLVLLAMATKCCLTPCSPFYCPIKAKWMWGTFDKSVLNGSSGMIPSLPRWIISCTPAKSSIKISGPRNKPHKPTARLLLLSTFQTQHAGAAGRLHTLSFQVMEEWFEWWGACWLQRSSPFVFQLLLRMWRTT